MTKNIFNWNHVSEKLTDDQIYELKALYKFYHKKYWLFKMTYKYFKKAELACNIGSVFNRRSRVRAVVTRGSTGLVGQNTSCKVHKVCISLWPTGWDDVRTGQER